MKSSKFIDADCWMLLTVICQAAADADMLQVITCPEFLAETF
jgi:hypothetical protein